MSEFFEQIVKIEYPNGATPDQRRELNIRINAIECDIFNKLPWLLAESEDKANSVVVYIHEILHRMGKRN